MKQTTWCIYVGLKHDMGVFQYHSEISGTEADAMEIASGLINRGWRACVVNQYRGNQFTM